MEAGNVAAGAPLTPQEIEDLKRLHAREGSPELAALEGQLLTISAEDRELCVRIALRAVRIYQDAVRKGQARGVPVDPITIGTDVAVTHLCRTLNLRAFLNADDFAFSNEIGTIIRFIDRNLAIFPPIVTLRFALR